MNSTVKDLHQKLTTTDSVEICDLVRIEKENGRYTATLRKNDSQWEIRHHGSIPDLSKIREYYECSRILSQWDDSGISDVNGWEYSKETHRYTKKHVWETPECNKIYLQHVPFYKITLSKIGNCIIDDIHIGRHSDELPTKFDIIRLLSQIDVNEFDYLYSKYSSIHENLTDVHGIGSKVAIKLIRDHNCETYSNVIKTIESSEAVTDIPFIHKKDTLEELNSLVTQDAQLIDENVFVEHSTTVVAQEI